MNPDFGLRFSRRIAASAFCALLLAPAAAQDKAAKIDDLMGRYAAHRLFNGSVLVAESSKVIYRKGFGLANMEWGIPNQSDTKFRLGSITKQFTAAVILQLANEGKLDVGSPISKYLPDYPEPVARKVTVHHLLTHTSGIPSYTGLPNFRKDLSRSPYTVPEFIKIFAGLELEFEPGSQFRYNNSGYFLLGAIIEQLTGDTYEEALRKRIFSPLGMSDTGYDHHEKLLDRRAGGYEMRLDGPVNAPYLDMSLPYSAGALYSTVEDLWKWDQALYSDRVLPERMRELMFSPNLENYAYGWFVRTAEEPSGPGKRTLIEHGGGINGFNTLISRVPQDRHLVVLLNNTGGAPLMEMSEGIRAILYGRQAKLPRAPVAPVLLSTYRESGVEAVIRQYREFRSKGEPNYDLAGGELGRLAQHLLRQKKAGDAVEIQKVYVELFPKDWQAHYGLAEAHREAGDRSLAFRSYVRALDLAPVPAARMLVDKIKETAP